MKWLRKDRPSGGRLPSLGQDYTEAHRRYVERVGEAAELWLRTKPFSVPPGRELVECLRVFSHIVSRLDLGVRAQVLDVGCGPGWLSEFLARCGYAVTGVDVSEDMVEIARERIAAIDAPIGQGSSRSPSSTRCRSRPALEEPLRRGHPLRRDAPFPRRGRDPAGHPPGAGWRPDLRPRGVRPEPGSEGEQELVAEMEQYGTLESPFDPEYLVSVLEKAGFEDVSRYAAVDELLDVSSPEDELRRVEERLVPADEHRHRREPRSGGAPGRRGAVRRPHRGRRSAARPGRRARPPSSRHERRPLVLAVGPGGPARLGLGDHRALHRSAKRRTDRASPPGPSTIALYRRVGRGRAPDTRAGRERAARALHRRRCARASRGSRTTAPRRSSSSCRTAPDACGSSST